MFWRSSATAGRNENASPEEAWSYRISIRLNGRNHCAVVLNGSSFGQMVNGKYYEWRGNTPLEEAMRKNDNTEMIQYLRSVGGRKNPKSPY